MLGTPSRCPRADFRLRASPPVSPPRVPRPACGRRACSVVRRCTWTARGSLRKVCGRGSFSTAVLPHTATGTSRGNAAISSKEKGANKATRWLRRFSPSASMPLCARPRPHSILPSYSWSSPDVLYVLTTRERAREARDTVVQAVQERCSIASTIRARLGCPVMPAESPS